MAYKAGTICEIKKFTFDLRGVDWSEKVRIMPWRKVNGPKTGPISPETGWNVIRFADGGMLLCHDERLRPVQ